MANFEGFGTNGQGARFSFRLRFLLTWLCHSQLITSMDEGRRSNPEDNIAMLEQLRAADPSAASHFLEYLILQKRTDVCVDGGLYPSRNAYHLPFRIDNCMSSLRTCALTSCLIISLTRLSQSFGGRKVFMQRFLLLALLTQKQPLGIGKAPHKLLSSPISFRPRQTRATSGFD